MLNIVNSIYQTIAIATLVHVYVFSLNIGGLMLSDYLEFNS